MVRSGTSHTPRPRARPGLEADVTVEDVGAGTVALRESIDTAYRIKYREGSSSMASPSAATATLRLDISRKHSATHPHPNGGPREEGC